MIELYLDIETIPAQDPAVKERISETITPPGSMSVPATIAKWEREKRPAAIEEAWLRTSFDGAYGHVVCVSWAVGDGAVQSEQQDYRGDSEGEMGMLAELFAEWQAIINPNLATQFIGHNVRDFDLRFLYHRAVVLGVDPGFYLPHDARPGDDSVFDTMTRWAGYGNRISLDNLCRALGLPGKDGMDGSMVWPAIQEGRIDDVAEYCRQDVERVRRVHRRMTFAGLR